LVEPQRDQRKTGRPGKKEEEQQAAEQHIIFFGFAVHVEGPDEVECLIVNVNLRPEKAPLCGDCDVNHKS
jgi:hypothetical protein